MEKLFKIPIRPVRIAFDHWELHEIYEKSIRTAVKHGHTNLSNYVLYNFKDKPVELYKRLRLNVDLCEELNVSIYSFPMKYHPIKGEHSHDRDYIGKHWNRKYIRAVQTILNATKGKIGRGVSFFEKAFGRNKDEYMELLIMPESFILFRLFFEHIGYTDKWRKELASLTDGERNIIMPIIYKNEFSNIDELDVNDNIKSVLSYYKNYKSEIVNPHSELYALKQKFDGKN